jgi:hypothetical protein
LGQSVHAEAGETSFAKQFESGVDDLAAGLVAARVVGRLGLPGAGVAAVE